MAKLSEQDVKDMAEWAVLHEKLDVALGPHGVGICVAVMAQKLGEACARRPDPEKALQKLMFGIAVSMKAALADDEEEADNTLQ